MTLAFLLLTTCAAQELCDEYVCHNGGICYNGTCVCPDPFFGPSCCEYPCKQLLFAYSSRVGCHQVPTLALILKLQCTVLYMAMYSALTRVLLWSYCIRQTPRVGNMTCLNNGTCRRNPQSNFNEYCECPYGYSGSYCQIRELVNDFVLL